MPTIYSHSRLESFKWCPQSYKAKYVDKIYPDMPRSMELFLGDMVHQSLEWLYHVIKDREVSMDDLIHHFASNWTTNYGDDIRIRSGKAQEYFDKSIQFLINYYQRYKPFKEDTVAIEKDILFDLDEKGEYKLRGFIDRLVKNPDGSYEVHDYKTSKRPKTQSQADSDWQLAFYHMGIQEMIGKDTKVKLIWHFLPSDVDVISERTNEQLEALRKEVLEYINMLENNTEWPPCKKPWCDWCAYAKNNPEILDQLKGEKVEVPKVEERNYDKSSFKDTSLNKYFKD